MTVFPTIGGVSFYRQDGQIQTSQMKLNQFQRQGYDGYGFQYKGFYGDSFSISYRAILSDISSFRLTQFVCSSMVGSIVNLTDEYGQLWTNYMVQNCKFKDSKELLNDGIYLYLEVEFELLPVGISFWETYS